MPLERMRHASDRGGPLPRQATTGNRRVPAPAPLLAPAALPSVLAAAEDGGEAARDPLGGFRVSVAVRSRFARTAAAHALECFLNTSSPDLPFLFGDSVGCVDDTDEVLSSRGGLGGLITWPPSKAPRIVLVLDSAVYIRALDEARAEE